MTMTTTQLTQTVIERFEVQFNAAPDAVVLAPGRVNLIGEYTDLNNGFVLPMAIDRYLAMALKKRNDNRVVIHSIDFNEMIDLDLNHLEKRSGSFQEYIAGCLWALKEKAYPVKGFEAIISGNIPIGAGLSSSAALELAVLRAQAFCAGFFFDKVEMAKIAQFAENNWVGVSCGIMDQLASSAGKKGHALLIDCESLKLTKCPMPVGVSVIVLDTDTRRGLVDSAYNERRSQCFEAAKLMEVPFLRDANPAMLETAKTQMDEDTYKRARHVLSENKRVLTAVKALEDSDAKAVGDLMNESHESLKHDFEVSSSALDSMVVCSVSHPACFGARMTGAGFGGCALALIDEDKQEEFIEEVNRCYRNETGLTPGLYGCKPSSGVTLKKL